MFLVDTLIIVVMVYGGAIDDRTRGSSPQRSLFRYAEAVQPKAASKASAVAPWDRFR